MIGAIVYKLKVLNEDSIPRYHGQLLHGVCFNIFEKFSPSLSNYVHNEMTIKPFTSGDLERAGTNNTRQKRSRLKAGETVFWRVTALIDEILQAFLSVEPGYIISVGNLRFRVEEIIINQERYVRTGVIDPDDMVRECFSVFPKTNVTMNFNSVTTFKKGVIDVPCPFPDLVFGSLADKWQAMDMPLDISANWVRDKAREILPGDWQGMSRKIFLNPRRGANGFIGKFSYRLDNLSDEEKQVMMLLAAYAEFSGVGRWTGHGLGQVSILS